MAANKTTVTHPDGSVSKRSSKSATYTHAVVVATPAEVKAAEAQATAAEITKNAASAADAAVNGALRSESKPWSFGGEYVTLYLGSEYAGAYTTERESAPTEEDLRAKMAASAAQSAAYALTYVAKAEQHLAGPAVTYGVLRWSSREDLAVKAAQGEFARYAARGRTVTVVPVDAK